MSVDRRNDSLSPTGTNAAEVEMDWAGPESGLEVLSMVKGRGSNQGQTCALVPTGAFFLGFQGHLIANCLGVVVTAGIIG